MAAFDSACTWLCATYQRRDGAALSPDLAFIRVTGSAIGFSQFSYRVLNGGRETNSAQSVGRQFVFAEPGLAETFRGARNLNHGARNDLKYRLRFVGSGQAAEVCRNAVVRC